MKNIICSIFLLLLLAACMSSSYVYKGEVREIALDITSNIQVGAVIYDDTVPYRDTLNNRAYRQNLGVLPLKEKIMVPKNINLKLTPAGFSEQRHQLVGEGLIITPTDVSITHHFEFLDLEKIIRGELNNLSKEAKIELSKVLSAYEIAISSPKYLVPSKLAEAKGFAQNLNLSHPQIQNTTIQKKLIKMQEWSDSIVSTIHSDAISSTTALYAQWIMEDISFLRKLMF